MGDLRGSEHSGHSQLAEQHSQLAEQASQRAEQPLLRLVTRLNVGGPARHALILTRELNDEFPTVLAVGTPAPTEGELSDPGVTTRRLPLTRELNPITDAKAFAAVRRLLKQTNPWLLHTHMAKA